ncbi:hypothetical protein BGZ99_001535 [Dissophora globulifera]|uniref:Proline dehydrogenase n=1 Tax=Dissophora globulifera TaxID=979702 RepID=A0A9P6RWR8_9FUNG|nr:hypothetical protein BGZ99_001535 [Dissophora globulifera]
MSGETAEDCVETMNNFKSSGIGSILNLSVEVDLNESELALQTPVEIRKRFNANADSVARQISTCILTASALAKSFADIKITALSSPFLLQQVSSNLTAFQTAFGNLPQDQNGKISKEEFGQLANLLPGISCIRGSQNAVVEQLFQEADQDQDGRVDWVDIAYTVSLNRDETRSLFAIASKTNASSATIPGHSNDDLDDYRRLLTRIETLCDQAAATQTRLMIAAEQTYFQPAIDNLVLHFQEHFNRALGPDEPLIYNTYQMYLKDALDRLCRDYTRSQRNGFILAAKLVRGAYMVSERKRAHELGLPDPICDGIHATHASFDAGVDFMLERIARGQDKGAKEVPSRLPLPACSSVVLVVASHNKDSVIRTCRRMQELGLAPKSSTVMFGQLTGMCDQVSYTLARYSYEIYKCVPYGPIHHTVPYLIRRAQENSSVLGGVAVECSLIVQELRARFVARLSHAQIQTAPAVSASSTTLMQQ